LYECIQNNEAYKTIDAPNTLEHRYIFEDIPHGLVALESVGKKLGLDMKNTSLIIDLASSLMEVDFRRIGRNLNDVLKDKNSHDVRSLF
ncbi:MAG: NADP transhydrogenase subunit alpha, partial [Clostridiales bacterium]|nr:NADP transhydrogenase subunit alpha [Clostridiales bacterium]